MGHDVERKFQLVPDAHKAVDGGGSFDLIVAAIDGELAARPQIISTQRHRRRNYNVPRHAVQRQVAADVGLVLTSGEHTARDFGAVESDLRILGRLEDYLAQLAVYDLLLLRREHVARLFERVGAHPQVQRSRIERAGRKLRFAGKITDLDEVIVPLKKERPAGEGPHHELTLAGEP